MQERTRVKSGQEIPTQTSLKRLHSGNDFSNPFDEAKPTAFESRKKKKKKKKREEEETRLAAILQLTPGN